MHPCYSEFHWRWRRLFIELSFRGFLPLLARLPARWGLAGAAWLGQLAARLDCDWRTVALREHFITRKTLAAYDEIAPDAPAEQRRAWLTERFLRAAQEELEGYWLALHRTPPLPCQIEGLESVQQALQAGRGLVLITFHFDAAIWGIAALGRTGLTLNAMSSNIVEDKRVPRCVQTYFQAKYAGLSSCLNGGRVEHVETRLRLLYQRLKLGQVVVVLADGVARSAKVGVAVDFLGRVRFFAPGALRLAASNRAPMAAFVCLREPAAYRVILSPVFWPDQSGSHEKNLPALFGFLANHVQQAPGRWWAADLLPNFISADRSTPDEQR